MTYSDREFGASQSDYPKEQQMSDTDITKARLEDLIAAYHDDTTVESRDLFNALRELKRLRAGRAAVVEECAKVADERKARWRAESELHLGGNEPSMARIRFQAKTVEASETAEAIRALKGGAA